MCRGIDYESDKLLIASCSVLKSAFPSLATTIVLPLAEDCAQPSFLPKAIPKNNMMNAALMISVPVPLLWSGYRPVAPTEQWVQPSNIKRQTVNRQLSSVIRQLSSVICQLSSVICHLACLINHFTRSTAAG